MKFFILGVLVCAIIGLLLRTFFFRQRWTYPEFMFVLMSISLATGTIFKLNAEKIKAFEDVIALMFVSLWPLLVILGGAWWGQFSARRLNIERVQMKMVLMATGYCLVIGIFAFPLACLSTWHVVAFQEDINMFMVMWAVTALALPGVFVELAARQREKERWQARHRKHRLKREPPKGDPS